MNCTPSCRIALVNGIAVFLAPLAVAAQQAVSGQSPVAPGPASIFFDLIPMLPPLLIIWYFFVTRPAQQAARQQQELMSGLKKGEQVATESGLIGRVAGIEKDHILLEIAPNVRVKFEINSIAKKLEPSNGAQA